MSLFAGAVTNAILRNAELVAGAQTGTRILV
jgi:hypothetical protein